MVLILTLILSGCSQNVPLIEDLVEAPGGDVQEEQEEQEEKVEQIELDQLDESAYYYEKDDAALYLYTYNKLPENYIKKSEANKLGWDSQKGNLWDVADGYVIGGDNFGNREKLLPVKEGRKYFEADVNYQGGYRGPERIVYSNDGLVFYTEDHYESFEQLY